MRTSSAAAALTMAALLLAPLTACGSTTPVTAPESPAATSTGAAPTATVTPMSALDPTPGLGCADLAETATTLTTQVHYVALNVGTENDSATYYPRLGQAMVDLGSLAEECRPAASATVDTLAGSVAALIDGMASGTDQATIDADVALLATVRSDGTVAYRALKLPTAGWENTPENRVAG